MNKYINMLIIVFFSCLTINYNLGFTFIIPILCYYIFISYKNSIIVVPLSLFSFYINKSEYLIYISIIMGLILIYSFILKNSNSLLLKLLFVFILNITSYIYLYSLIIPYGLFFSLLSSVILGFFYYNQEGIIINKNTNYSNNEFIMALICCLGAIGIEYMNINIGVIITIYFIMYFSSSLLYVKSIFYSTICMFSYLYLFDIEYSFIFFIIAILYFSPKMYPILCLYVMCSYLLIFKIFIDYNNLILGIMFIGLFFEIFKNSLIYKASKNTFFESVYEVTYNSINNEVVTFATFLDMVDRNFGEDKEYSKLINEGITSLVKNVCDNCPIKKECYNKNKGKLYYYYKNLILLKKDEMLSCPNHESLRVSAYNINNRLDLNTKATKNDNLSIIIKGLSNIIRQYSVGTSLRIEQNYDLLYSIKKAIIEYGYSLSLFNIKKSFVNDFYIEIGLCGVTFKETEKVINSITSNILKTQVSVLYESSTQNKTYFKIVPKINFEVSYGYGSLAQIGNSVCGDNFLIKQLDSSKLMAVISDGMGKGLNASSYSSLTLKLLDEITSANITSDTSLQILNTFYYIQDYQENYSTIDYLEINRQNGEVTFFKAGGTSTYIFHENGLVDIIANDNLPFGLEEIIEIKKKQLVNNDLIIMASDGVFENVINQRELENYINSIKSYEPQRIAYEVLNYARYTDVVAKDDMSVIALKIKES